MIKVFVFVSGLTLASLPIGSDGEPIVFSFPDKHHALAVYRAGSGAGEDELVPVPGLSAKGFEIELSKQCSPSCPASTFRNSELYWFPDISRLAGNAPRRECAASASVAACQERHGSSRLLAGTLRLRGDWELAARTDCRDKGFPIDVSTSARETLVNARNPKEPMPLAIPQPYADAYRLETELGRLDQISLSGLPSGFQLQLADPKYCRLYGETSAPCAMLLIRFAPTSKPAAGGLAEHFEHLYDLMTGAPAKPWAPFMDYGKYCDETKHVGGGHPRCLGGYVAY